MKLSIVPVYLSLQKGMNVRCYSVESSLSVIKARNTCMFTCLPKILALVGSWKGWENLKKTYYLCYNRNSYALALNLIINHYLSEICNLIYPMACASRSSSSLPYNSPPKSGLLLFVGKL